MISNGNLLLLNLSEVWQRDILALPSSDKIIIKKNNKVIISTS